MENKRETNPSIGHFRKKPIERTNALTLNRDSVEYFESAKILNKTFSDKVLFKPTYFLILRSIELGFKSLIKINESVPTKLLVDKYGHDINKLMNYCIKKQYIKLNREEKEAITLINTYYKSKLIEYTAIGYKEIPLLHYYFSIAKKINENFHNIAETVDTKKYI